MSQKDAIEQEIYDRLLMYFDGNTAKIHDAALDIAEYIGRIGERPKKEMLLVPLDLILEEVDYLQPLHSCPPIKETPPCIENCFACWAYYILKHENEWY